VARLLATAVLLATPVLLAAGLLAGQGGALWRAAYPYLPRQVQAVPYRLRALAPGPQSTPLPLPTPAPALPPAGGGSPAATVALVATATPAVAASATASPLPLPAEMALAGLRHEYQTWNNCGPATISMALSHYGVADGQAVAARSLKPDPDDKNVGPEELARYAGERGYLAPVRANGDLQRLKALLAHDVIVIVETWFIPEPADEMGHYRVLTGYSDPGGYVIAADSYEGPSEHLAYATFDDLWRVFNRVYIPVYPSDRSAVVAEILGPELDDRSMYVGAVARAQAELSRAPDAYGWFNLGSSLLGLGDPAGAVQAYDRARAAGLPWRMLWYQFGPFEAYAAQGRWSDVLALADTNLRNAPNLEESHYWRGRALAAQGDVDGARAAWERARQLNGLFLPAAEALARLN
jgi:tetratricopeptide (TPR) repeat protein